MAMGLATETEGEASSPVRSNCDAGQSRDPLDSSLDCVKSLTLEGLLTSMNPEGLCLMEIEDFSLLQGAAWQSLWPEVHRATLRSAVAKAASGSVARFSADCPTAKGTLKHWDVLVSPVHDADGTIVSLLAISRDVTREVYVASERMLVARELAHRIANLFTIVDGVIGLSARANPESKAFASTLRTRLGSLGRAVAYVYGEHQDRLHGQGNSVHGLLCELLDPYGLGGTAGQFTLSGQDHSIAPDTVTPLALIFNELGTNALKHGALATPGATVHVSTSADDDTFVIDWKESGVVNVMPPTKTGFGTTLLDRTVSLQLGATIERSWKPDGLKVRLTIPLRSL